MRMRVDKVHIELEVLPEHDFEDVYLAVAVGYDQPASRKKRTQIWFENTEWVPDKR